MRGSTLSYAPGIPGPGNPIRTIATSSSAALRSFYASNPYDVKPITDNGPFFWHFERFSTTLSNFAQPLANVDREIAQGERVLLLLLFLAILLAAVFLLLPFLTIRDQWRTFNRKGRSAIFFATDRFGFFFFEITLIQRLTLFLGYPTYSLTVTIASLLIFVGIGALLSGRVRETSNRAFPILLVAITALTAFYLFGLTPLTNSLLSLPLAARIPIAFVILGPLGMCLGMFMPLGLGAVARPSEFPREYVAWGWAVNGFASVVGSTLTTIFAMSFGFSVVLVLALVSYVVAILALRGPFGARRRDWRPEPGRARDRAPGRRPTSSTRRAAAGSAGRPTPASGVDEQADRRCRSVPRSRSAPRCDRPEVCDPTGRPLADRVRAAT